MRLLAPILAVYAVPSEYLRAVAAGGAASVAPGATLVVATRGDRAHATRAVMTDVIAAVVPGRPVVALSGPSFAAEVGAQQPTAVVAASGRPGRGRARTACDRHARRFRVYRHDDVLGVGLAGAIKNVIAIAIGNFPTALAWATTRAPR